MRSSCQADVMNVIPRDRWPWWRQRTMVPLLWDTRSFVRYASSFVRYVRLREICAPPLKSAISCFTPTWIGNNLPWNDKEQVLQRLKDTINSFGNLISINLKSALWNSKLVQNFCHCHLATMWNIPQKLYIASICWHVNSTNSNRSQFRAEIWKVCVWVSEWLLGYFVLILFGADVYFSCIIDIFPKSETATLCKVDASSVISRSTAFWQGAINRCALTEQ